MTLCFVIWIQKLQFMRFDLLCMMAGLLGLGILLACHLSLEESLVEKKVSKQLPDLQHLFKELKAPYELLGSSRFLQIRLAQMLLQQLGNGWESVQDSFMISILGASGLERTAVNAGWGPGDWDLFNVPISSFRELWGMATSGLMVQWTQEPGNAYCYMQMNLLVGSLMCLAFRFSFSHVVRLVLQSFAPFSALFLLIPRRFWPLRIARPCGAGASWLSALVMGVPTRPSSAPNSHGRRKPRPMAYSSSGALSPRDRCA